MSRLDRAVIAGLVLLLGVAAISIGGRARQPTAPTPGPSASVAPAISTYTEGVLGRPTSASPLSASTAADRDLVALIFEGLVTLDAAGGPRPALARSWTSTADGGTWTFHLRPDARWHDGEPVTADDVVFTIETIEDPDYHGPGAGSWTGVTATAVDPGTVRFALDRQIVGFIDLVTQPIAPRHLLGDIAVADLARDRFGEEPVGSGPYAVIDLDRNHAVLAPAATVAPSAAPPDLGDPSSLDPLATPRPTPRSRGVDPAIQRIELRFFDDAAALAAAFRARTIDAASGLDPDAIAGLGDVPGSRLLREPSTTLTAIALNLRPVHPELADPQMRLALLKAIDRQRIGDVAYNGLAVAAEGLIPPSSWAFDGSSSPSVSHDVTGATGELSAAGWTKAKDGWRAPGATAATELELLVPAQSGSQILAAVGSQVAADWTALGLKVRLVEIDPAELAADRLRTGRFTAAVV